MSATTTSRTAEPVEHATSGRVRHWVLGAFIVAVGLSSLLVAYLTSVPASATLR